MSLRILHVLRASDSDAGRSIRAVCELSAAQIRLGHHIELVALGGTPGQWMEGLAVPIHRLPDGRGTLRINSPLNRWIMGRAGAFDCIIVHGIWDFCSLGTWRALRDSTVPFFVFTHGMLDPWFKHRRPLRHFVRWFYWLSAGYPILRDAHAVFFLSDDERFRARDTFWLYDCHEFVVRQGVMGIPQGLAESCAETFLSGRPELRGKRLFTVFADPNSIEGLRAVMEAIESLSQRGAWDIRQMRLVIACSDIRAVKDRVESDPSHRAAGASLHWTGPLTDAETWGALRASEVFLRPSSYEICCGRVADALSAGTPVLVATGLAIWKDIVNDGAGLADESTAEGCMRVLEKWMGLPHPDKVAMRARARQCFEERYTHDGAARTLISAIYLLIGVHRDGRWDLRPLKPASELP